MDIFSGIIDFVKNFMLSKIGYYVSIAITLVGLVFICLGFDGLLISLIATPFIFNVGYSTAKYFYNKQSKTN